MSGLIERSAELAAIEEVLSDAERGSGRTLLFAGQAGVGKSSLLEHAQELARDRGIRVLHSCATPVSAALAHGVVRDWVGPLAQQSARGSKPFDGPAVGLAEALSGSGPDHHAWSLDTLDYALSWAFENLCEEGPLLLVVDDVQWVDSGSLLVLDLLSARLQSSPIVLLLGRRTGEPALRPDILERITGRALTFTPQPLTVIGVDQLRRQLPSAAGTGRVSSQEVHRLTGGLPFLVRELLRSWPGAGRAPHSVVESVRARLGRLGDPTLEVARTVALLGDEASFDALGELCGLTVAELADPLEVLTDADIVTLGLWRAWPSHPLVREAILSSMTPSERSAQHHRAAGFLAGLDRPRQVIASHLVHTLAEDDPSVVELLRAAAEESLESGAPHVAASQLLRAVGETAPENTDPQLLRHAAAAHMRAGLPDQAFELWDRAVERMGPVEDRAFCLADVGDAQMRLGERAAGRSTYVRASRLLQEHGHDASSPALRLVLARMGMVRAMSSDSVPTVEEAIAGAVAQPPETDSHADRLLFAFAANRLALEGRDAATARTLALRAEAGGRLLTEESCDGNGFYMAMAAFVWTDCFEEGLSALDQALAESKARGSTLAFATASCSRGYLHYRRGNLRQAVADLHAALEMRERGWHEYVEPALAGLCFAHVALGQVAQAQALEPDLRAVATGGDMMTAFAHTALGVIRASRGDHLGALVAYDAAATATGPLGGNPGFIEWRELAVWSLLQVGRRAEARDLAQVAVNRARAWGSPRAVGFAIHVLSQVSPSPESDRLLREAISLLEGCGAVDQLARVQISLGTRLMRAPSTRREAADLLQQALDYARATDVPSLVQRATQVLLQHGVKVAEQVDSPLQLLTAGERRVVELAVAGQTNRQIAQELFVTVKAVEWHLSNTYRKLAISSRAQLPAVLAGQPDPGMEGANSSAR